MDKNRLWIIGSVLAMVALLALGWLLGIQPQLTSAATAVAQRVGVEQVNAAHEASLAKLKEDFTEIDALNEELVSISRSVPFGTDVPDYVDQLDALAKANNVTLKALTVADPAAYTPVAPAAPVAPPAAEGSVAAATPTPAPAAAPVETAPAPGAPPVTNETITSENFASLGVNITVAGNYSDVLNFVNGLQTGSRLFLVTGLATKAEEQSVAPETTTSAVDDDEAVASSPSGVEGTISGLIYALVTSEASAEEAAE
jgi:Tfp pilus assembly protein PilO